MSKSPARLVAIVLLIVIVWVSSYYIFFYEAKRYVYYVDDFSIQSGGEPILEDEIGTSVLSGDDWISNQFVEVVGDVFHSPPYSIALELKPPDQKGGVLELNRSISGGWETLNFTWQVMVPDMDWKNSPPQRLSGEYTIVNVEFVFLAFFSSSDGDTVGYITSGLNWLHHSALGERRRVNLWAIFFPKTKGGNFSNTDELDVEWEFDRWYLVSLVMDSSEDVAKLYLDGQQVLQLPFTIVYVDDLTEIRWQ